MSALRLDTVVLPSASLGPPNPLPPLAGAPELHANIAGADLDAEMRANLEHGRVTSLLPYLIQDRYDRVLKPREHRVAVLENDHLRAEFMLDLGGRLRSLIDRTSSHELLYANRAFQPANLALRNAWFAGGVEWNIGMRGHTPLTCSPLHAAHVKGPAGVPALRLWEYERVRQVVYQLDVWLPERSPVLLVAVRVENPNDHPTPMYWWSNIAVPEAEDVRVLAPGKAAWRFDESAAVRVVQLPEANGDDWTYPARARGAADYFMQLDAGRRPWIAALDGQGKGLVHTSTRRLHGRKLFVWGNTRGGRHWQEWLSPLGGRYLEIQAGLLRTQLEHTSMPARAEWSWLEAYGPLETDPVVVHGTNWSSACTEVEHALTALVPDEWLDDRCAEAAQLAERAPEESLHGGSGWGALERRLRDGDPGFDRAATPFSDDTLGREQEPWVALLTDGRLPKADPAEPPKAYQVGSAWSKRLEQATSDDWRTWLLRGVARHHRGDTEAARAAWRRSFAATPNAWALRNLAVVETDPTTSTALLRQAVGLVPGEPALVAEFLEALLLDGRPAEALDAVDTAPVQVSADPLVRFLEARAAVATGDETRAQHVLMEVTMPWVREGSRSLDDLWFQLEALQQSRRRGSTVNDALLAEVRRTASLPYAFDFRMSAGPAGDTAT